MDHQLQTFLNKFEDTLQSVCNTTYQSPPLGEALQYGILGPGKRVRPSLVFLCNQALGGQWQDALAPALSIEMIHTYSLIHDDLPCMDDDDVRRGRATVHKKFDEATALLVGDALLTDAFSVLSGEWHQYGFSFPEPQAQLSMIKALSTAAGSQGMIRGQALDLYWTARKQGTKQDLDQIHTCKTGHLIGAACALGALSSGKGGDPGPWHEFGHRIGLAFQIIDDLLDSSPDTGKSPGKDLAQQKLTYLSFMDRAAAQEIAEDLTNQSLNFTDHLGQESQLLRKFVANLLKRSH